MKSSYIIIRYGHSIHKEGSLPLGTYASHIILGKGTTLVYIMIICYCFDLNVISWSDFGIRW